MKMLIIATLQVEGFHRWPDAPEEHNYLSNVHRHIFKITVKKLVNHSNREIEIIEFKRLIIKHLHSHYGYPFCDFRHNSCEDMALHIMRKFQLDYVKVLEDGENGAEVWA